ASHARQRWLSLEDSATSLTESHDHTPTNSSRSKVNSASRVELSLEQITKDELSWSVSCVLYSLSDSSRSILMYTLGTFSELDICDVYSGKSVQTSKGECN
ncbi:hypothetical protein RRG08_041962, partial [Elysia crispata]